MIRNYFKIAWRNITRNKVNSFINIAGLAIGLTCVILIALFIKDELNYDQFFDNASSIYRVNIDGKMGDNSFYAGYTPPPAGAALVDNYPEVESYTRLYRPDTDVIEYESAAQKKLFNENNIYGVDSNFLELLTYPLAKGDRKTCLNDANSVVITPQIAKKYFGDEDPMGKILSYGTEKTQMKVTGVLGDMTNLPASVKFDFLMPIKNYGDVEYFNWSWVWLNVATYVKLSESASKNPNTITHLEEQFPKMLKTQAASAFERIGQPYDKFLEKGNKWDLHLQPLTDIHLRSGDIESSITEQNSIQSLYIFGLIAFFIIVLACVNFMNLATAQSAKRSKEIGIRKVLGSQRKYLIRQFLTEALLFTAIATVLALIFVIITLPLFNQISGKQIYISELLNPQIAILILGLSLLTAFLAGIYPAFYLTSFKPVNILKGNFDVSGPRSGFIRNGLVVFQFVIAITLVISTIVVYTQLRYTQNRELGYDKENLIILNNAEKLESSEETFRQELMKLPQVKSATISSDMLTRSSFGDFYVPEAINPDEHIAKDLALGSYLVDNHFIKTLDLKIIKGRGFEDGFSDSRSVIINETAAKQIGWENPIGRTIRYPGGENESYNVVGVLKDFNIESLHSSIVPFALFSKESKSYNTSISFITLKLNSGNPKQTIASIKEKWQSYQPNVPFEYSFLDEDVNAAYIVEQRTAKLFGIFTGLSIFVACLGLFGLVAFIAQKRTKEIGIRKVLGASVTGIVKLLSIDFIKMVIISLVIASPIAWYAMHKWLEDFAFRIDIEWWVFALAGVAALTIALVTVSFQAIRAAIANPVKSLRTE